MSVALRGGGGGGGADDDGSRADQVGYGAEQEREEWCT